MSIVFIISLKNKKARKENFFSGQQYIRYLKNGILSCVHFEPSFILLVYTNNIPNYTICQLLKSVTVVPLMVFFVLFLYKS